MFKSKKKNESSQGFTLVELIMVIVIIGLLAAIVIPRFGGQADMARVATTQANLANLRAAVDVYRLSEPTLPTLLTDLTIPLQLLMLLKWEYRRQP